MEADFKRQMWYKYSYHGIVIVCRAEIVVITGN